MGGAGRPRGRQVAADALSLGSEGQDSKAGLVLRALRFRGRDGVDDAAVRRLRALLGDSDQRDLRRLRPRAVGWMRPVIDRVAQPVATG